MRPIHVTELDKPRPAVVLTRVSIHGRMNRLTVAPITTRVRGLSTEVPVGRANGLEAEGVIHCDNIATVRLALVGRQIGTLLDDQEEALTEAIHAAFDLY